MSRFFNRFEASTSNTWLVFGVFAWSYLQEKMKSTVQGIMVVFKDNNVLSKGYDYIPDYIPSYKCEEIIILY